MSKLKRKTSLNQMVCLCFLDSIISKILIFSYTTQCQETFQKGYCSTFPTYRGNLKKSFHIKDTTKNSIKTMDISSLLNTDLGNLNDLSLTL